MFGNPLL
jgi:hypothetical protein